MAKFKFILLYIGFFCAVGCKTKQKTVEKVSEIKSDTLIVKSKSIETPPILTSLNILEICDTVTGKPKEFRYRYVVEKDTLEINLLNNELSIKNSQVSQLKRQLDSVIQNSNTEYVSDKSSEKVTNRIPFKYWIYLIVSLAGNLFLLYRLFRNKLPF